MRESFDTRIRKRSAVNKAESDGNIADSMEVRAALIERMGKGELTLAQVQQELANIKRNAKKNGKVTRQQAWSRG